MSDALRRFDAELSRRVAALVGAAVKTHGVPVAEEQAIELVDEIYPQVIEARKLAWHAHIMDLGRQAVAQGVELAPEPPREYSRHALFKAVTDVSRLTPNSPDMWIDVLDEQTQKIVKHPVAPNASNRFDPLVVQLISEQLGSRVSRHALAAGRNAVVDSVHNGTARDKTTKKPRRVGYARVLSGKESCAFCAMLASRGPVYKEDTVVRRHDGRRYHDNCDCVAVLVVHGQPWEGQAEHEVLEQAWRTHAGNEDQFKNWKKAVHEGKVDARAFSPSTGLVRSARQSGIPNVILKLPSVKGRQMVTAPYFSDESIPNVESLAKHSIWGWNEGDGEIAMQSERKGHSHDSVRKSGTFFPKTWTDQDIADAIVKTIESPVYIRQQGNRRFVVREVNGVLVEVQWRYLEKDGGAASFSAYPIAGAGVETFSKGNRVELKVDPESRLGRYGQVEGYQ